MIPWLIFRRADSDAENWLESRHDWSGSHPLHDTRPTLPWTRQRRWFTTFTKARLATLWAIPWISSFASTLLFHCRGEQKHSNMWIYWSRESEIHGLRIDILSAEWAFLSRVRCCFSLIRKQADIRTDLWHPKNPVMSFASNPLCRLSIPFIDSSFARTHSSSLH